MFDTRKKFWLLLACSLALTGCAKKNADLPKIEQPKDSRGEIVASLEDAARSVAYSLSELAVISKAEHPPVKGMPFTNVEASGLDRPLSLTWYGPIAPALEKIAGSVEYRVQVYGKPPKTPILVNIGGYHENMTALELIRDVDIQAGLGASVLIFPEEKIISLRYDAS